jgi:hypothetical protein
MVYKRRTYHLDNIMNIIDFFSKAPKALLSQFINQFYVDANPLSKGYLTVVYEGASS